MLLIIKNVKQMANPFLIHLPKSLPYYIYKMQN